MGAVGGDSVVINPLRPYRMGDCFAENHRISLSKGRSEARFAEI